jgi:hypothetical protein
MSDEPKQFVRKPLLWILRSVVLAAIASVFIRIVIGLPPGNWIAAAIVGWVPAMILCVEIQAWRQRLRR